MIGSRLTHYAIVERLGSGGMGEVFKARDIDLERFVAIKVLPPDKLTDVDRRERFFLEARAASALNHPNIVTIYEIARQDETEFLVMEYVRGKTLDLLLRDDRLPLKLLLNYAAQVADALAAAHAAGIIHRDIKPSNLMITPEGRVKVLDFGLAKSIDGPSTQDETTKVDSQTAVGTVMGTVNYMSPEQAEGKVVDKRTDIFSFGAVLYEMCTGKRAFSAESSSAVIAAVLIKEPFAIDQIAPEIPAELQRVVNRCLRKDPNRRFQDMLDVKLTLEEMEADVSSPKLPLPGSTKQVNRTRLWWIAGTAAFLILLTSALWLWPFNRRTAVLSPQQFTFDRGLTTTPAISSDGNLVAYASDRAGKGNLDIWVQYRNGNPVQATHDPADEDEPSFSPDGTQIAFRSSKGGGGIYVTPSLGSGEPRLIVDGIYRRPRFSPDGAWLLLENPHPTVTKCYVLNLNDPAGSLREIAPGYSEFTAVLSPDGKQILFAGAKEGDAKGHLLLVSREGGTPREVQFDYAESKFPRDVNLQLVTQWLSDDRILLDASIAGRPQLWISQLHRRPLRIERGEPLTVGTGTASSASVSKQGALVFSSEERESDLWCLPYDRRGAKVTGEPRRLTQDSLDEEYPSISNSGELVTFSISDGPNWGAWALDMKTGKTRRVTGNLSERGYRPVISPDGTRIAFTGSGTNTYVIPIEGGALRKVSSGSPVIWSWTSDSHALFQLRHSTPVGMTLVDVERAKDIGAVQLKSNSFQMHMSHRGDWLMIRNSSLGIVMAPTNGHTLPSQDEWRPIGLKDSDLPRWAPDDNSIVFISQRDSFRCLYAQRLQPETKRPVGDSFPIAHFHQAVRSLKSEDTGALGVAVAADKIVVAQIERSGNIWSARLGQ